MERYINFVISVKNGYLAMRKTIEIDYKKTYLFFLNSFKKYLIIKDFEIKDNKVKVFLNYIDNMPIINDLKLISKSSLPHYYKINKIKKIILEDKKSLFFFSTNKGILIGNECIKQNIGGKLLFKLW
jgi:ribosomal protein S8